MKKEKSIIIKNTKLRNLRNFLRRILILKIQSSQDSIENERKNYKGNIMMLSEEDKHKVWSLRSKIRELDMIRRNSISYCELCGRIDQDMVFIPENNNWYCVECQKEGVIVRL